MASKFDRFAYLLLIAPAGCNDVSWPSEHYVDSLRVLGVRAEPATLAPGATTQLSVTCADGRRGAEEEPTCDVEIAWFADCNNPRKNDPQRCFARYADYSESLKSPIADTPATNHPDGFGFGPSFSFTAPDDILKEEISVAGHSLHAGASYVYFAVCAGQLFPVNAAADRLPVECRDRQSGKVLDQSRFVVGRTTIYSYDLIASRNPEMLVRRFDEVPIASSCSATSGCPEGFSCDSDAGCIPVVETCSETNRKACKPHCLDFELAASSYSLFGIDGTRLDQPQKSMWLDYFTNVGQIPDDARYIVRPQPNPEEPDRSMCILWRAPTKPTEHAHVWVVLRDNRGGLATWDQRIIVQ